MIPLESVKTLEGNGELLLKTRELSTHTQLEDLTLPGRQKEKTVLGWRRSQSLSQQQFKSQVPGVKSQTQIDKAGKGSVVAFSGIDSVQGVGLSDESGGAVVGTSGVTGPRTQEVGRARAVEEGRGRAASESIRPTSSSTSSSSSSCGVHIRQPGRRGVRQEPESP